MSGHFSFDPSNTEADFFHVKHFDFLPFRNSFKESVVLQIETEFSGSAGGSKQVGEQNKTLTTIICICTCPDSRSFAPVSHFQSTLEGI